MDKNAIIDDYIDQINQIFPRTNDYNFYNLNIVPEEDVPKHQYNKDYQFANTYLDIEGLNKAEHEFELPKETNKFIYKLNFLRNKSVTFSHNHLNNVFITKDNKKVTTDITIDKENKYLEYSNLITKNNIPINLYKESYKYIDNKEEITRENDRQEDRGNKKIIVNTRSKVIYEDKKYKETTYEKDIIVKYGDLTEIEVVRINDYMLANGVRINKRQTKDKEECIIFYKNELNESFKNKITSSQFDELLKIKDDSYQLENNELIYNLKRKKNKRL